MKKLTSLFVILTTSLIHSSTFATNCEAGANSCSGKNANQMLAMNSINSILSDHLYDIQPETSKVEFRVDSPIGEVWASFKDFKGGFAMPDNGALSDPAIVNVNTDSLDTDGAFIGMLLKSESFFDVENFPSIRFVGSSFEWFNDSQAVLKGHMTIQNRTKPVAFYVELVNANPDSKYSERITMKASTTIRRSEFGIYTLLPIVSDNVNLYMSVDALKRNTSTI
jgi:polyisoprenoid-binding protein YceI